MSPTRAPAYRLATEPYHIMEANRIPVEDPVIHPTRRNVVLRALILLPAWALFVFWWLVVFQRVTWPEARYAILFIAISTVTVLVVTVIWIEHNLRIFRRKGPRRGVWSAEENFTHDMLGCPLEFRGGPILIRQARLVRVAVEAAEPEDRKSYAPGPVAQRPDERRPAGREG